MVFSSTIKVLITSFLVLIMSGFDSSAQEIDIAKFVSEYKKAMKGVKSIKYEVNKNNGELKGVITYKEGAGYVNHKFLFLGEEERNGFISDLAFSDNNEAYFLYRKDKLLMNEKEESVKVFKNFSQAIMNTGMMPSHQVFNGPFSSSPQYGYVSKEHEVKFLGFENVNDVPCVKFEAKKGDRSSILYVGRDDHLLRKLVYPNAEFSYNIIDVNHPIKDEVFDLAKKLDLKMEKGGVLEVGSSAPTFTLQNLNGETISLADYPDQIVVLDFWGTWCKPCIGEIPELKKMSEALAAIDVVYFGISCFERGNFDAVHDLVEKEGIKYSVLLNGDDVSRRYHVTTFPTMVVVDGNGKIMLTKGSGGESDDMSYEAIVELIKSKQ